MSMFESTELFFLLTLVSGSSLRTFAVNMCERLTQMLSALSTPVKVKLQLIEVFQHMHHDAETAAQVTTFPLHIMLLVFSFFLVKETSGILFFGQSFRKPARKASSV